MLSVLKERLARLEQEVIAEENRERRVAEEKRKKIDMVEQQRSKQVDDSQMVDEMFGFINDQNEEGAAPSGFKVLLLYA